MAEMLPSPRAGRAASVSSHGTAASTALSLQPRYVPRPDPRYISQTAAADRVTRLHLHDQFEMMSPSSSPTNEGAVFNENALNLLNSFLDALLYNFLGKARSTSLNKLRPAIREVLKAKLARDALAGADEEIQDLYEDLEAEIDGEEVKLNGSNSPDWHLEETFKLMRLRVMVFLGLGDFDDEDEERFLEEEEFHINGERASPDMTILNGPTAVYLASVLEYLAERLIDLSGEAAYVRQKRRMSTRPISESQELEEFDIERVSVEETDVEKIALNPTYGRLWRTWRKQHRGLKSTPVTPVATSPRHARVPSEDGPFHSLRKINRNGQPEGEDNEQKKELSLDEIPGEEDVPEHVLASNIPLPMNENDVDEIEVPGLAKEINDDEEGETFEEDEGDRRPRSAIYFHEPFPGVITPHGEEEEEPESRPELGPRKRSLSAPHLTRPPFMVPPKEVPVEEGEVEEGAEGTEVDDMGPELVSKEPSSGFAGEEDEEYASADERPHGERDLQDGEEKQHPGMVAGVLTGAAALVGSAIAAVAGGTKQKEDADPAHYTLHKIAEKAKIDDIEATKGTKTVPQPVSKTVQQAPLSHEEAVAQEMGMPKQTVKPVEKPAEPQDDGPMTHEEAIAREMGVAPPKKSKEAKQTPAPQEAEPPAKVASVDEIPDLAAEKTKEASVTRGSRPQKETTQKTVKTETAVPAPVSKKDQPIPPSKQEARSMVKDDVNDPEAIGVARTSDIRIHSPSPTPDQGQGGIYGHIVGQDRRNENFARPSSRDRNAPFGGTVQQRQAPEDDYNVSKPQQKHATPSPLREVASATGAAAAATAATAATIGVEKAQEPLKERQQVAQSRDKPVQGTPAVQQSPQQGTSSTATVSTVKRTSSKENTSGERAAKVPPLQTDFQDPVTGRPPSSNYSARSSAASQTPHSARGSQSSIQPRALDKRTSDDTRQRNFDDLVKGEETVKYTLTPDNLRDDPYNLSVHRASSSSQTGASDRSGAAAPPPQVKRASPPRSNSQRSGTTAAQQPPSASPTKKKVIPSASEYRRSYASLSQRPQPMNTDSRKSGLMPREPRVVTDQMRDFADYLRSTAPANDQQATPAPLASGQTASKPPVPAKPRNGARMQAREPDVKGNTSSELIDFIRRGPPGAQNGEHRIPRTVAPFRTTMDSDDFKDYSPGSSNRQSANDSTSGLLPAPNGASTTARTTQPASSSKQTGLQPPTGGPVRKQRRVKDPYAIDSDEDDDDTLTALPNGSRGPRIRKEESLQDFLRNTEPPAGNSPQPLIGALPNGLANGVNGSAHSRSAAPQSSAAANRPSTQASAAPSTASSVPKKRFEARVAGATRDFQSREYHQTTSELASFLGSSGPPESAAPGPNVPGKAGGGLKSAGGSKRGRQRGWLGLRGSKSVDA